MVGERSPEELNRAGLAEALDLDGSGDVSEMIDGLFERQTRRSAAASRAAESSAVGSRSPTRVTCPIFLS